jgi:Ca-activated chloride channel family protein
MKWLPDDIYFAYPQLLWLLLLVPAIMLAYFFYLRDHRSATMLHTSHAKPGELPATLKTKLRDLPVILRAAALSLMIIAMARPQSKKSWQDIQTEGIDIMLSMDISASMLAQDLKPNRLDASKEVAKEFIDARPDDRIGLVIFSGESFTQCPLTSDHAVLKNIFTEVKTGMLADGTAIGLGLANAVSRIKSSKAKSKVIILLTDGVNNAGNISPSLAAEAAKPWGIRIYTIGVGTRGMAYSPVAIYPNGEYVYDYVQCDIDEATLKSISGMTGGKYFRATNRQSLKKIYEEIDKMEKSIVYERHFSKKSEWFFPFALLALILLIIEFTVSKTYLRSLT